MKKILLINGPNLNLLGTRQPEIYGSATLDNIVGNVKILAHDLGMQLDAMQSNHEGAIIDAIQVARNVYEGIIINPAAYSHSSIAIPDALNCFEGKVVEVHISNIHVREEFRHHSYVSHRADKIIIGEGVKGYEIAIDYLAKG